MPCKVITTGAPVLRLNVKVALSSAPPDGVAGANVAWIGALEFAGSTNGVVWARLKNCIAGPLSALGVSVRSRSEALVKVIDLVMLVWTTTVPIIVNVTVGMVVESVPITTVALLAPLLNGLKSTDTLKLLPESTCVPTVRLALNSASEGGLTLRICNGEVPVLDSTTVVGWSSPTATFPKSMV